MTALADLIDPAARSRLADSAAESATTPAPPEECVSEALTAASRHPPIGGTGRNVIANVEQLRQARGLSFRALSEMLGAVGRPILPAVLHRLSQGKRRVDADDLVAFAAALGVTPADLLLPPGTVSDDPPADHPATREARNLAGRIGGYIRLAVSERREAARELADEGMSQRDIGAALGVGPGTVNRDLNPVPNGTLEPKTAVKPQVKPDAVVPPVPDGTPEPEPVTVPPPADHPATREARNLAGRIGEALASPGDPVSARRLDRALTRVRVEVEELLEESASHEKAG